MLETVQCESCGTPLLAFEAGESEPINHEECPNCDHGSFRVGD